MSRDIRYKTKEDALKAVRADGLNIRYCDLPLRNDPEIVWNAVKSDGMALAFTQNKTVLNDRRIAFKAVQTNGSSLHFLPEKFKKDTYICSTAIRQCGNAYYDCLVPELKYDKELLLQGCMTWPWLADVLYDISAECEDYYIGVRFQGDNYLLGALHNTDGTGTVLIYKNGFPNKSYQVKSFDIAVDEINRLEDTEYFEYIPAKKYYEMELKNRHNIELYKKEAERDWQVDKWSEFDILEKYEAQQREKQFEREDYQYYHKEEIEQQKRIDNLITKCGFVDDER